MNLLRSTPLLVALFAACLSACAIRPVQPPAQVLFNDALFAAPAEPVRAESAFALSPAMRRYADEQLKPKMRHVHSERALVDALYGQGQLQLEYDAESTRDAAGAFAARTGNCLSLLLMTGAFAEHFGLSVLYQEVFVRERWSRSGSLALANRHVNLRFVNLREGPGTSTGHSGDEGLTVDFLPSEQAARYRSRVIARDTVIAMFLNNRAAELLAAGQPQQAYWWVREAIIKVPMFTDSYNLLGLIYEKQGHYAEAETSLRRALALEPENTIPMSNLVTVLARRGQTQASRQLAEKLADIEPYPPFHFYDEGLAALKAQDFARARALFQREIRRDAEQPDAHFALAITELYLGEPQRAKRQLARAIEHSTTSASRALYSRKRDWLEAEGHLAPRRSGTRAPAVGG